MYLVIRINHQIQIPDYIIIRKKYYLQQVIYFVHVLVMMKQEIILLRLQNVLAQEVLVVLFHRHIFDEHHFLDVHYLIIFNQY